MLIDKISIIIPCYLTSLQLRNMTQRCVDGIESIDEIIVVDDGSPLRLPVFDKTVIEIELPTNQGYAAAVNAGLEATHGDYLIICNNDIEFIQPDWLDHLLKPLEEGYSISSIRTSDSDGFTTEDRYEENAKFGSIWAMKKETYEQLGLLDESFGKGYYEDQDYWRRAREAGLKIVKNHNGLVDHIGKATFNEVDKKNWHLIHAMLMYKKKWGNKMHIYEVRPQTLLGVDDYDKDDPGYAVQIKDIPETTWEEIEDRWKGYLNAPSRD